MTQLLGHVIADFETQLAAKISVGDTTGNLTSATDDDGVALPAGRYFFTIDKGNSKKEHISCSLSGTTLTNIKSVSRQGVETSGVAREHRVGANVIISDFAHIKKINDLLDGTTSFDSGTPLGYDGAPSITTGNQITTKTYADTQDALRIPLTYLDTDGTLAANSDTKVATQKATKTYVDGVAVAGAPNASTTVKGIVEEATQSEYDAGTDTGGTGARLFVVPSIIKAAISAARPTTTTMLPKSSLGVTSYTGIGHSTNTELYFGMIDVTESMTIAKVTFWVSAYTASGTTKFALYSLDGQTKHFEFTSATVSSGSQQITTTLGTPYAITPGKYYLATCSVGSSNYEIFTQDPSSALHSNMNFITGEYYYTGIKTITAGTIPSTIDPTASVTSSRFGTMVVRFEN